MVSNVCDTGPDRHSIGIAGCIHGIHHVCFPDWIDINNHNAGVSAGHVHIPIIIVNRMVTPT